MLLSFGSAVNSLVLSFLREIFTANAASPPPDTEPTTINPTVDRQKGHMVHLALHSSRFVTSAMPRFAPVIRIILFSMFISFSGSVQFFCHYRYYGWWPCGDTSGLNFLNTNISVHSHAISLRPSAHTTKGSDHCVSQMGQRVLDRNDIGPGHTFRDQSGGFETAQSSG